MTLRAARLSRVALLAAAAALTRAAHDAACAEGEGDGERVCWHVGDGDHQSNLQLFNYTANFLRVGSGGGDAGRLAPAPAPNPVPAPDYSETKDAIGAAAGGVVSTFSAAKDLSEGKFDVGSASKLISGIAPALAFAVPPPAGLVAAGALSAIGGIVGLYAEKGPTSADVIKKMDVCFKEVKHRLNQISMKLDRMQSTLETMDDKLDEMLAILRRQQLHVDGLRDVNSAFLRTWRKYEDVSNHTDDPIAMKDIKKMFENYYYSLGDLRTGTKALSPKNLATVFDKLESLNDVREFYKRILTGRFQLFWLVYTHHVLSDYPRAAFTALQDLTEDCKKYTDEFSEHFREGRYKHVLKDFEGTPPEDEDCRYTSTGSDCVLRARSFSFWGRYTGRLDSWCLSFFPALSNSFHLSPCTSAAKMVLNTQHMVAGDNFVKCLTRGVDGGGLPDSGCGPGYDQRWYLDSEPGPLRSYDTSTRSDPPSCLNTWHSEVGTAGQTLVINVVQAQTQKPPRSRTTVCRNGCRVECTIDKLVRLRTDSLDDIDPRWDKSEVVRDYQGQPVWCGLYQNADTLGFRRAGDAWLHPDMSGKYKTEWIDLKMATFPGFEGATAKLRVTTRMLFCTTAMVVHGADDENVNGVYVFKVGVSSGSYPVYQNWPKNDHMIRFTDSHWVLQNGAGEHIVTANPSQQLWEIRCPDEVSWTKGIGVSPAIAVSTGRDKCLTLERDRFERGDRK